MNKYTLISRSLLAATVLACGVHLTACSVATTVAPTETPVATRVSPLWPTSVTTNPTTPSPIPTMNPHEFVVQDTAFQSWINENLVTSLVSDSQYVWAATPAGLVRWTRDMQDPTIIGVDEGLLSTSVSALSIDGAENLWICYENTPDWTRHDGETWQSMSRNDAIEQAYTEMQTPAFADTEMWAVSNITGWVWIPAENGMVQAYDGAIWRTYGPYSGVRDNISRITVSSAGRVWALGDGLCTTMEGYVWWHDHTLFADIPNAASVTGIATDTQERVWLSFQGSDSSGGLCNLDLDLESWTGYIHTLNPAIPDDVLGLTISDDQSLSIWGSAGIAIKEQNLAWDSTGFEGLSVNCSFVDSTGLRWLGTDHGILQINGASEIAGPWLLPESSDLGQVHAVTAQPDDLLISTDSGLVHILENDIQVLSDSAPLWLGHSPHGTNWYSLPGILASTDSDKPVLEGQNIICAAFGEASGRAYASDGTLWQLEDGWELSMNWLEQVNDPVIDMAFGPDGTLYLSTPALVYRLDEEGLTELPPQSDLVMPDIRAIAIASDNTIWAGTSNGLYRTADGATWFMLSTSSTGGGLQSMDVRELEFDSQGNLWLATRDGISRRTPEADWFYLTVPGTQHLSLENESSVWGTSSSGLYRATVQSLIPVP